MAGEREREGGGEREREQSAVSKIFRIMCLHKK